MRLQSLRSRQYLTPECGDIIVTGFAVRLIVISQALCSVLSSTFICFSTVLELMVHLDFDTRQITHDTRLDIDSARTRVTHAHTDLD